MSEILLDIGDILRRTNLKEASIYQAILHVPWHCVKLGGFEEIVDDIRARAEGSLYI
jgi:hypothetical protein